MRLPRRGWHSSPAFAAGSESFAASPLFDSLPPTPQPARWWREERSKGARQMFPTHDRRPCLSCESNTRNLPGPRRRDAPRAPRPHRPQPRTELPPTQDASPVRTSSADAPTQPLLPGGAKRLVHRSSALRWNATRLFPSTRFFFRASVPPGRFRRQAHRTRSIPPAPPTDRSTHVPPPAVPTSVHSSAILHENAQSPPRSNTPPAAARSQELSQNSPPQQSRLAASLPCPAA